MSGWKTALAVIIYVGFGIIGQLVLSRAMRQMPPMEGFSFFELLRFMRYIWTTPQVILGVALLAVNFGALLLLLSTTDVSVVVPSSAVSYLLLTLLARYFLRETVPPERWLGVFLITVGVCLVLTSTSASKRNTTPEVAPASPVPRPERIRT
jgi:multidrug transporter EmrE-like cation transporter